ncbi:hypothetical protein NXW59_00145 [Bacteroides fragilis]|nr:hypothetical protein [Bacteroides fragilis]
MVPLLMEQEINMASDLVWNLLVKDSGKREFLLNKGWQQMQGIRA